MMGWVMKWFKPPDRPDLYENITPDQERREKDFELYRWQQKSNALRKTAAIQIGRD